MAEAIRVAVVDDSDASREVMLAHLGRYEHETGTRFSIRTFNDGQDLVRAYASDFDIVFLDVQMPRLDGFETARVIRTRDEKVVLVFVTNLAQYAIRGYEVDALNYLVKPVTYFAFARELKRGLERVERPGPGSLVLRTGDGLVRLNPDDVHYIESSKHRIVVHMHHRMYAVSGTLKTFETELAGRGFFRSNSCYLVNLRQVVAVTQTGCVLPSGVELVVSRARRRDLLTALTGIIGGPLA